VRQTTESEERAYSIQRPQGVNPMLAYCVYVRTGEACATDDRDSGEGIYSGHREHHPHGTLSR